MSRFFVLLPTVAPVDNFLAVCHKHSCFYTPNFVFLHTKLRVFTHQSNRNAPVFCSVLINWLRICQNRVTLLTLFNKTLGLWITRPAVAANGKLSPPLGGFAPAGSSASLRPRYALPPGIPQGFALLSTPPEGAKNDPPGRIPPLEVKKNTLRQPIGFTV
jgi:hypothetical protein